MDSAEQSRVPWWKKSIVIVVTLVAVISIYRQLDAEAFVAVFKRAEWVWLLVAVAFFGVIMAAAIARWHLALGVTGFVVHFGATVRSVLIYHFVTVTFLGASVGDVAKSVFYSRWYGFRFPEIFAASKLDRFLGTVGNGVLWVVVLGYGAWKGAFSREMFGDLQMPSVGKWIGVGVLLVVAGIVLWRNYTFRQGLLRFWNVLLDGSKQLLSRPAVAVKGAGYGLVVQGGLSFVLAFNLAAVIGEEVEWSRLLWLFPVIQVISALPFTVAGLGVREAAAITLLGMYNVPKEEAAAAALLTLGVNLIWAAAGGVVLWRESRLMRRSPKREPAETISVVIPTLNEENELPEMLKRLSNVSEVSDIIVVDGGSADATVRVASSFGCRVVESAPGRGRQLRAGASKCVGDVVLMLHADTWLPEDAGTALLSSLRDPTVVGGAFWKRFREYPSPVLLGSRAKCWLRLLFSGFVFGDQGIFVRREVLESIGGVPEVELMEEFELCDRLRRVGRLTLAAATVSTSARRFAKFGAWRTYRLMWLVTRRYRAGVPPTELKRIYESGGQKS